MFWEHAPRVLIVVHQTRYCVKAAANCVLHSDSIASSRMSSLLARRREEDPEIEGPFV
ncbi:hypothetical protein FHX59_005030 [Paraburkholderia silvatlantica]|uniref:Uncharacterized protein n=1 Tax=Paraburkholderia silvatlantica TaxID=321895 RepID=A0ABR6FT05_9BURK|nr:hypothetical protein [Paraburkholderia silvatlantica]PVY30370.1 hypothetical protein C7411_113124 [Paraburkholderia silvatlantica]PXW36893.1 hypothetical protein C7413_11386 [Paraburkholderia silvatlantica]